MTEKSVNEKEFVGVIRRVGQRVGGGLPLAEALALEWDPTQEPRKMLGTAKFGNILKTNLRYLCEYRLAVAKELALMCNELRSTDKGRILGGIQFILERRHAEAFGKQDGPQINNVQVWAVPLNADQADKVRRLAATQLARPTKLEESKSERKGSRHEKTIDIGFDGDGVGRGLLGMGAEC